MSEVEKLCDHIGIIHNGKLLAEGTLPELRARSGNSRSRRLICDKLLTLNLRNIGIVYRKDSSIPGAIAGTVISMIGCSFAGHACSTIWDGRPSSCP